MRKFFICAGLEFCGRVVVLFKYRIVNEKFLLQGLQRPSLLPCACTVPAVELLFEERLDELVASLRSASRPYDIRCLTMENFYRSHALEILSYWVDNIPEKAFCRGVCE